jgi:hypothetical protein
MPTSPQRKQGNESVGLEDSAHTTWLVAKETVPGFHNSLRVQA